MATCISDLEGLMKSTVAGDAIPDLQDASVLVNHCGSTAMSRCCQYISSSPFPPWRPGSLPREGGGGIRRPRGHLLPPRPPLRSTIIVPDGLGFVFGPIIQGSVGGPPCPPVAGPSAWQTKSGRSSGPLHPCRAAAHPWTTPYQEVAEDTHPDSPSWVLLQLWR